jgi:hypothetical protein
MRLMRATFLAQKSHIPKLLEDAGLMELRFLVAEYLDMRLQRLKTAVPIS